MWHWNGKDWEDENGEVIALALLLALIFDRIAQGIIHADALAPTAEWLPLIWEQEMQRAITREYIIQYLLGRGGVASMTPGDWDTIRSLLSGQFQYLRRFRNDLPSLSEAQIRARSRLYIRSAQQAFWYGRMAARPDATDIRWVVHPEAEHCPDCLAWDALDWQSIASNPYGGCVPGSGCTECLTNCRCHLEFK